MSFQHIPCTVDPNHILTPVAGNLPAITNATVEYQETEVGGRTAVIAFNGAPQAFLTLDNGGQVIGYSLVNQSVEAQASVENIIGTL